MIPIQPHYAPIHTVPVNSVVETQDGQRVHIINAPSNNEVQVRNIHAHDSARTTLNGNDPVRYISSIIDYEALAERA